MEWFELHAKLPNHPKVQDLADALEINVAQAVGHLVMLWCWCFQYAKDGALTGLRERTLAQACGWFGIPGDFVKAMVDTGWLDRTGHVLIVHDWADYGGKMLKRAEANREGNRKRQAEFRARKGIGPAPAQPAQPVATAPSAPAAPKPKRPPKAAPVYDPIVHELARHLAAKVEAAIGEPPRQNAAWLQEMDRMLRIDQRKPDDVRAIIDFGFSSDFWPDKLLNPGKVRKHYEGVKSQMRKASKVVNHPAVDRVDARPSTKRVGQMTAEDKDAERVRARQLAEGLGIIQ